MTFTLERVRSGSVTTMATVSGVATNAGTHTGSTTFAFSSILAGDTWRVKAVPSAPLTATTTDNMASAA